MSPGPTPVQTEWSKKPRIQHQQRSARIHAASPSQHADPEVQNPSATRHYDRTSPTPGQAGDGGGARPAAEQEATNMSPGDYSPDICGSPGSFNTPESSTSGESMNNHGENITPPESPAQADSPGATATTTNLGRLSLEHNDSHNRVIAPRQGRGILGAASVASKRAASTELRRPTGRRSPVTGHPNAQPSPTRPVKYGLQTKRGHRAGRHGLRRGEPGQQSHGDVDFTWQPFQHDPPLALKQDMRQKTRDDSGYVTMQSRANTEQNVQSKSSILPHTVPPSLVAPRQENRVTTDVDTFQRRGVQPITDQARYPGMILQPDSSPISQDQLAAEVKGIYAGLVMVEAKCINIDAAQAHDVTSRLGSEQWQALIALHRTLLYEHHDFLMATQHPSATPALRGLAVKYSMPARMWKHGIHAFLEVLRHRRPESQDYMLAFIYLAYQMMALLYETVPSFLDTWIECLGDLARYRMAIEEEREAHAQWGGVAARWYTMAADRHPAVGRLNHHLGILERPSLRKLFCYNKALTCVIPFPNAKDSLSTLCGPIVQDEQAIKNSGQSAEASIVTFHAMIFAEKDQASIQSMSTTALRLLGQLPTTKLRDFGASLAIVNVSRLIELGKSTNPLWQQYTGALNRQAQETRPSMSALSDLTKESEPSTFKETVATKFSFSDSRIDFYFRCFNLVTRRYDTRTSLWDMLPFVHVMLVHFHSLHSLQVRDHDQSHTGGSLLSTEVLSWGGLSDYLNSLSQHQPINARVLDCARRGVFLAPERQDDTRPLAEDHMIRGLIWAQWYFASDWFVGHDVDEDGRAVETANMQKARAERVLWLGLFFAFHTQYLSFDMQKRTFIAPVRGPAAPSTTAADLASLQPERFDSAPNMASAMRSPSLEEDGFTVVKSPQPKPSARQSPAQPAKTWANVASQPRKVRQDYPNVKVVDDESMELGV